MLWRKPPWHQTVHDAAFIIKQQTPITDLGSYTHSPFPIDAHIHVAGFLLNADVRKPKHEVHIANHIGSLRMLDDLTKYSPFLTHATIQEQDLQSGMSLIVLDTSVSISDTIDLYDELLDAIAKWSAKILLWEEKVADAQQVFTIRNACFIKCTPASPCRGRPWPQAEDLKPWSKFPSVSMDSMMSIRITTFCQQETDAELAAAFFSDNRTVAATLEALDESPEPKIVEKSPSSRVCMSSTSASISHCLHGSAGDVRFESTDSQYRERHSQAGMIQGNLRSREDRLFMTTDGSGTVRLL
ncbi:hypothetical protein E4U51_005366 [Claviceps purpurea]|nr:hypothetical protein E4U51_005366 [Claviceps purpurea]